tara:strand:+ start:1148 stop:1447 length:300 start_codon:yes stop_codon:yes gene_type:complete
MDSSIENITQCEDIYNEINKKNKISQPFLSKYEKTKIIGLAAQQIESGREPNIVIPKSLIEPIDIAEYELKNKKTPFIIKRKLPNNVFEYWTLDQLHII